MKEGLSQMVEDIREGRRRPFSPAGTEIMLILPADKAREVGAKQVPLFPVLGKLLGWNVAESASAESVSAEAAGADGEDFID